AEAVAFAAAISLSMLVSFSLTFIVNASGFWMLDAMGLIIISNIVLMFFSGFLLPLAFFPPRLASIAAVLPFQAVTSLPAQVFLGKIRGIALGQTLLLQLFWAVVLAGLALLVLRAATRKVTIQGG
ncbi:MAG TPA: ABC-2 family transporter protein, partial [Herpetosiphonaceae bacterium]|nr:ABC-2 family transporter protein [Herpetosiphonaceae bacterium]